MSLINQMLRDLDRRQGAGDGARFAAVPGFGPVAVDSISGGRTRRGIFRGLAVVAGVVLVQLLVLNSTGADHTNGLQANMPQPLALPPEPTRPAATDIVEDTLVAALPDKKPVNQSPDKTATMAIAAIEAAPVIEHVRSTVTPPPSVPTKIVTLTPGQTADRLFNQAQAALAAHDRVKAVNLLEQVLSKYPQHSTAREQLAMLMLEDGHRENAETLLSKGLMMAPGRVEMARAYGQLLVERGALLPALQTLQPFTDGAAADAIALALQAGILDRLQRYSEAAASYRRALQQQPRQAVWWTGLGLALEHQGQPLSALDAYRQAAQLPLQVAVENFVQQRIQVLDGAGNRAER